MRKIRWLVMKVGLLLTMLPLCIVVKAQAASFDCAKATTKVEKMICGDVELSKMDEEMAAAYKTAQQDEKQASSTRQAQKAWLKERNRCADVACTKRAYKARLLMIAMTAGKSVANDTFPLYQPSVSGGGFKHTEKKDSLQIKKENPTFKLAKDTGWNVCRDLVENLNNLHPTRASFSCEIQFDPKMKQFSWPEWQELKIEDHWQEIYAIEKFLIHGKIPPFDDWLKEYQTRLSEGFIWRDYVGVISTGNIGGQISLADMKENSGKMKRLSFHPRLRQAQVRFEADGPLETILSYSRERNDIKRCFAWEEIVDKCDGGRDCPNTQDKNLKKDFEKNWGEGFDRPGEHFVFYDLDTQKIRSIGFGNTSGSDITKNLVLHNGRAYLLLFNFDAWLISHVERRIVPNSPENEKHDFALSICDIIENSENLSQE